MFSPHLRTTSPWSSVIPILQSHPLNFVPASLAGGVDIQLTSDYGILFYNATTTTDTTTTAPSKDYTELLARIDRILHSSTPQLTIFYLGDNPWDLQLKVHETFTESVTVLPLGRVEDIPSMLVEMARSCAETRRYLQQRAGEDKVRAEWLLGCMGLSEHAILMLHSMFASFNELADAVENGDEKLNVLDEADRTALKKFWGEELVFRD